MEPPKKESGDSPLRYGCGGGPLKKDVMEEVDARLGSRNEKGNKEWCGTSFDKPFSCEKAFKGVVILLGLRECVSTSVKDS